MSRVVELIATQKHIRKFHEEHFESPFSMALKDYLYIKKFYAVDYPDGLVKLLHRDGTLIEGKLLNKKELHSLFERFFSAKERTSEEHPPLEEDIREREKMLERLKDIKQFKFKVEIKKFYQDPKTYEKIPLDEQD